MTITSRTTLALVRTAAAAGLLLAVSLITPVANAATDTSPPVWSKPPTASIPLGATLSVGEDGCGDPYYGLGPVNIDYRASDPESGISRYEIGGEDGGGVPTQATRYVMDHIGDHSGSPCGGGQDRWRTFVAYNGAGLATGYDYSTTDLTWHEDSPAALPNYQIPGTLTYSGTWATSNCACWAGGTTHKTSQKNAAAKFTFTLASSSALGLVMAQGPDRGSAAVYIDGTKVATINTNNAAKVNRTVVWRQTLGASSHTLRIVNLATAGHPRIDLDAIVAIPKTGFGPYVG